MGMITIFWYNTFFFSMVFQYKVYTNLKGIEKYA